MCVWYLFARLARFSHAAAVAAPLLFPVPFPPLILLLLLHFLQPFAASPSLKLPLCLPHSLSKPLNACCAAICHKFSLLLWQLRCCIAADVTLTLDLSLVLALVLALAVCTPPNAVDRTKSVTFVPRVRDESAFASAATDSKEGVLTTETATAAATPKKAEKRRDLL